MLILKDVSVSYGNKTVVDKVSLSLSEGSWLMLCGPNGAGKSTLVNAISRSLQSTGDILLDGYDIRRLKPHDIARKIAVLAQSNSVNYAFTVDEVVSLGRYACNRSFLFKRNFNDNDIIERAIYDVGLTELRYKSVLELSGGEIQRVFLAQVFAQDPKILILDEPANHLDLKYQKQLFSLIEKWLELPDRSVISVVHDLNLARRYGTDCLLMNEGRTVALGSTASVLSGENLINTYKMDVQQWMCELLSQWKK